MITDLIVGIASSYTWQEIYPFVVSLRRSGYQGRCALIIGNGPSEPHKMSRYGPNLEDPRAEGVSLLSKLDQYGIQVIDIGNFEEHPIIARFPIMAASIWASTAEARHVFCVDVKDVVFQKNPATWLHENLGGQRIAVQSEEVSYRDSPGNSKNALEAFGPETLAGLVGASVPDVLNAGVIAGHPATVAGLLMAIYDMTKRDRRPGVLGYQEMLSDQTAMNVLLRREDYAVVTSVFGASAGFVFEAGLRPKSEFRDGVMYAPNGEPYVIVHQYFCEYKFIADLRRRYREQ